MANDLKVTQADIDKYWEPEFYDIIIPMLIGAAKGYDNEECNWLKPTGATMAHKDNVASIHRHLAEYSVGMTKVPDADVNPLLCIGIRALMSYVRQQRGIKHVND